MFLSGTTRVLSDAQPDAAGGRSVGFLTLAFHTYCKPSVTKTWTCGRYVGYSPSLQTVIVAHRGADASKIEALATDANIIRRRFDSTLFPGISSDVGIHDSFGSEQEKTATQVLVAVQSAVSAHGAKQVTIVGHSLGVAISLIDSVYLPLHDSGVSFKTVLYGMPRLRLP
ncbi:hypothetical protein AN958_02866 [Leucoagaricus sp. SymC.cos]|nr:hypothetical protein AN958_02866 [Leucoagaricus sp. SymC.cos]